MANPYHHAVSSAKRYGGVAEDYLPIHQWFDQTKAAWADPRHRAVLHSTVGIFLAESHFGVTITRADGRKIPTRWIGEQHVIEDCGFIPTLEDWLGKLPVERWMRTGAAKLSTTLTEGATP